MAVVGIIGSGISGIATAVVLKREGHSPILFERSGSIGGIWATAYPQVRLQNTEDQYRLADLPWPFTPDEHPSSDQVLRYLQAAVATFDLDIRFSHDVRSLVEEDNGWRAHFTTSSGEQSQRFDFIVSAVGHYSQPKAETPFPGRELFRGDVINERTLGSLDDFAHKRVLVVGFGKTAVDLASFAAERHATVSHVFRTPRWLLAKTVGPLHAKQVMWARAVNALLPAWAHPSKTERWIHATFPGAVQKFWTGMSNKLWAQHTAALSKLSPEARERLELVRPEQSMLSDMRASAAIAPDAFYAQVARGEIMPYRDEVTSFTTNGVRLASGRELEADIIVLALGASKPVFPFMPQKYRDVLERADDGVQLYRHLIHPDVPNIAFAGFNHCAMHVSAVEISALWLSAMLRGELVLPPRDEMHAAMAQVTAWKRQHLNFEPSRGCGVSMRFQQYLDVLLMDLGISPYRKSNPVTEVFQAYRAKDYANLSADYRRAREKASEPRRPVALVC